MTMRSVEIWSDAAGPATLAALTAANRPIVLRGLASEWPAVRADDAIAYLSALDRGAPVDLVEGPAGEGGRLFYTADRAGLNFAKRPGTLREIFDRLRAVADAPEDDAPAIAAQAADIRDALPGFVDANRLPIMTRDVPPRIWIGNRVVVAAHQDMASNIAVVVSGRRRFTLIAPEHTRDLAIGPFEFTPAGTPVSMIDPEAPDLNRYPRAGAALETAQVADLSPGDAIYIPYMWWHHVRSRDPVSVLVNYWWNEAPAPQPGLAPIDAMVHAILSIGDLPEEQRAAWAAMFDQFVFADDKAGLADFAPQRHGLRGELSAETKARLRRQLGALMAR